MAASQAAHHPHHSNNPAHHNPKQPMAYLQWTPDMIRSMGCFTPATNWLEFHRWKLTTTSMKTEKRTLSLVVTTPQ